ncbi:PAC2 family-domain-containing protein [Mycena maculata]|uniref:Proteasome assembly chaperone 2 n=1 Tax=Mycena maculata TaxID=230809 RepID=A0AAD7JV88_9AGAR|nr:PAC2 family-domain-containing protein [Mycena maculata]
MVFFHPSEAPPQLAGKTIIIPVVSTANVSQLAADLLIATLSLDRIGTFDSAFLVPVVGSGEDGMGVSTPLELYGKAGLDVVIMQQRSPTLKSHKHEFIHALLEFIETSDVSSALFLSGVDLSNRTDSQMMTPTYQIRPSTAMSLSSTPLARLSELPIPEYSSPVPQYPLQSADEREPDVPFIPGGSLTRRILQTLSKSQSSVPTAAILQFVLEGDNRADAALLASVVVAVLGLNVGGFKEPRSWKQGLFGAPPDQTLYG